MSAFAEKEGLRALDVELHGKTWSVVTLYARVGLGPGALRAIGVSPGKLTGLSRKDAEKKAKALDHALWEIVRPRAMAPGQRRGK